MGGMVRSRQHSVVFGIYYGVPEVGVPQLPDHVSDSCSKMSLLVRLYVTTLNRHPWKTQALTTGINLLGAFRIHIAAEFLLF